MAIKLYGVAIISKAVALGFDFEFGAVFEKHAVNFHEDSILWSDVRPVGEYLTVTTNIPNTEAFGLSPRLKLERFTESIKRRCGFEEQAV
ncbi:MAG: hypothetical protein WKF30_18080 [Pyrinomonadaceae bacterium]